MKRTIFFTVLCFLAAVSVFAQADLQPAATVNLIRTEAITVRQLRSEVERYQTGLGRVLTQAERLELLDRMINERLVLQAAERDRIIVSDNEITQYLRNTLAQQIGRQPTDAEYAQAVRESDMSEQDLREQIRKQLIGQKLLQAKKGDLIATIRIPTEAEITAEYNIRRSQLIRPQTVRLSIIHVPYGTDAAARTRARELANRLVQEIASNTSRFDEVAARSVAPNSGYQSDTGYIQLNAETRDNFGQNFMNAAFNLTQGQVSGLIEGVQGFQIIKVTENYAQKNLDLYDLIQLGTNVTVRDYIGQFLLNQKQEEILTQATEEMLTELRANGRSFTIFPNNLNW